MDVLVFVRELKRMRKFYYDPEKGYCSDDCPAKNLDCMSLDQPEEDLERIVGVVEAWSATHPHKTRQRAFLKQYPNAKCVDGIVAICPKMIDASLSCPGRADIDCPNCRREFWMQEVE
nr:MAG TPA: Sphingolipid Delta4-desaturase (DES) [Caudoviricetes sp.]